LCSGKLGLGDIFLNRQLPTEIESLSSHQIKKLASMSTFSLALSDEGDVFLWGTGGALSLSLSPSLSLSLLPQKLEALPARTHVVDIACGLGHSLFLAQTGVVFVWGSGSNGRLGLGDTSDRSTACVLTSLLQERICAVVCGASHSLCLTKQGSIYSWGKNSAGQCGSGHCEDTLIPAQVKRFNDVRIIMLEYVVEIL
jgi:alpha-tubulin suppressor-like RCC1 family protein